MGLPYAVHFDKVRHSISEPLIANCPLFVSQVTYNIPL